MMLPTMLFAALLALAAPPPVTVAPRQVPRFVLSDDTADLDRALASTAPPRELPIRISTASLPAEDASVVRLIIAADVDDRQEGVSLVSVAYLLTTDKGERAAYALRRRELRRTSSGSLSFTEIVTLRPGAYRLKVAAMRKGRIGTGEARVTARLQSSPPLRLGDLLVGETPPADDATTSLAPGGRVGGDRLAVSLPIGFDSTTTPDVGLTLDVAKGDAGAVLLSAPLTLPAAEGRLRLAQGVVDARLLPAGNYVATVRVAMSGKEVARVAAPVSIERAAAAGGIPAAAASPFRVDDVLDPVVLGPFLDELTEHATDRTRPAIERARAGKLAEAAGATASNDPNDPVRPFLRGLSLLSRKELQTASDAFRDTLRAAPDYFAGQFYLGVCYAAGGRDREAVNAWQISLVGLDRYPIVFRLLADALVRLGQPDGAVDTLEEAVAKWPEDNDLNLRLARAALATGRYERVSQIVDTRLDRRPVDQDIVLAGLQAIFEDVTRGTNRTAPDQLGRFKRFRDAYIAEGGSRLPLVNEWLAAVEKRLR